MTPLNRTASLPRTSTARLDPLDSLFRVLAFLGALAIVALVLNLLAQPTALGLVGQNLFIRLWFGLFIAPAILLVGALGVWRMPGNVVGRFLILIALGGVAAQFHVDLGAPVPTALAVESIILFNAGLVGPALAYLMLTFPTGRVHPPRWARAVPVVAGLKFIGVALEILATPGKIKIFSPTVNPLFVPALRPLQPIIAPTIGIAGLLFPLLLLAGLISLLLRYRAAPTGERQQIKWVLWGFGLLAPAGVMAFVSVFRFGVASTAFSITFLLAATAQILFLASIAIAILRYHLFDIDIIINRTLVYGSLTLFIVAVYVLVVGYLSELLHERAGFLLSLLATGLIAVLFEPLRQWLQRGVNHLIYGERDDPYKVLAGLSERIGETLLPEAVLPTLTETIAQTLKLPYAAISLANPGEDGHFTAAYGLPKEPALHLALAHQGERIGELIVAQRAADEPFTPAEKQLLNDIAIQAGAAVHSVRLTADLRRARQRLVSAREEERRRIRRDLHDGLGPQLASQSLTLDAIDKLLDRDPELARWLLHHLKTQSQEAIAGIRRLIYGLRPPALDDLGLAEALRQEWEVNPARDALPDGLQITLATPAPLPPLSAAVELAAYRIVQEAVNNVVKHAQARRCVVRLEMQQERLVVDISDDGRGLPATVHAGVGLHSLRERAEEVGGRLEVGRGPGGGTRVRAWLPGVGP